LGGLGGFNSGKSHLFRYDGQKFTWFSAEDGAPSSAIIKISQDSQSRLWVGTVLEGVYVYDGKRFITSAALRQVGLVYDIFHDRQGNTWLVTNRGVVKIGVGWQPESGEALMRNLTTTDGLPHNEVRCLLEDKAGHLWFGTSEGLTRYTPSTTPPLVHIEKVVFADQTVQRPKEVEVSAAAKRVVIHYNAPSFRTPPHQMQYRGKLEGRDSDWSLTKERSVALLNLKPGEYTFFVKAIDRDLNESEPVSVTVKVVPPFYATAGFLLPTFSGGAVIVAMLVVQTVALVKRRRQIHAYQRVAVEELQEAKRVQMSLLPKEAPVVEGLEIAGTCMPANTVGGDFYDYLSLGNTTLAIVLADVTGKSMKAAMNAVLSSGALYAEAKEGMSPSQLLGALNLDLHARFTGLTNCAMMIATVETNKKVLRYANAGIPYPILRRSSAVSELESSGMPLGAYRHAQYEEIPALSLQSGDVIVFFSDGITEAPSKDEEERLYMETDGLPKLISEFSEQMTVQEMMDAILADVRDFSGNAPQSDDITVVVVKVL